jgi:glycerophosphoryl diester phosphodiesterase
MDDELKPISEKNHIGNHISECVAHRGFSSVAPENTLPAYTLAKSNGFRYVECDVSWTSDNVPVLLHDATIDRTSDGTGNIGDLTLAQLESYDFGSWKSAEYKGTKIPTFEEFIMSCKELSLHPYIEIKRTITPSQAALLVDIVEKSGMISDVTWISFSAKSLSKILAVIPSSRIGYVCKAISEAKITSALSLRTAANEVFINCDYTTLTPDLANSAIAQGLPVEAWTVDDMADASRLADMGVCGVTTDTLIMTTSTAMNEATGDSGKASTFSGTSRVIKALFSIAMLSTFNAISFIRELLEWGIS